MSAVVQDVWSYVPNSKLETLQTTALSHHQLGAAYRAILNF